MEFFSERITSAGAVERLQERPAENPFHTPAYVKAMEILGYQPFVIGLRSADSGDFATAFIKNGRLSRLLEIPSLPKAAEQAVFWEGIYKLCRSHRVTDLIAGSFGSPQLALPPLRGEVSRKERCEYVVRLQDGNPDELLSTNHRRNVKKARNAGVVVRRTRDAEARLEHTRLMSQSLGRRAGRGESVAANLDDSEYRAFMESGAGEIFQAGLNGTILSSVLVLRSPRGAYYHSAGTSPEGMSAGASHFLLSSICEELKREAVNTFNLGGADRDSSLARFKSGFGAEEVSLAAASCYIGPIWQRKLKSFVNLVRTDRPRLIRFLTGSIHRVFVFSLETNTILPTIALSDARFQHLSEADLAQLPDQMSRVTRFGKSYAYAVYLGNELAHIAWLLPASVVNREYPPVLHLADDEAEITGCETLPAFRGKGVYGYAIQQLFGVARSAGIRKIYMKTMSDNKASQSGILKAGLKPAGVATIVVPPALAPRALVLGQISSRTSA